MDLNVIARHMTISYPDPRQEILISDRAEEIHRIRRSRIPHGTVQHVYWQPTGLRRAILLHGN